MKRWIHRVLCTINLHCWHEVCGFNSPHKEIDAHSHGPKIVYETPDGGGFRLCCWCRDISGSLSSRVTKIEQGDCPDTGEGIDSELKFGRVRITVERLYGTEGAEKVAAQ